MKCQEKGNPWKSWMSEEEEGAAESIPLKQRSGAAGDSSGGRSNKGQTATFLPSMPYAVMIEL